MRWIEPRGHERVLAGLWRAASERRLAHALCFSGPHGVGKFLSAEWLTAGLLCARGPGADGAPCGSCGPCRRVRADSHPDVFVIDPIAEGEEEIKVQRIAPRLEESVPNVGEFLSLKPMEGGWRIVLVREAERMNEEAQNALLKTLEEPGDSTLIVLVTSRPDVLLATIHSRCLRVRFDAPGEALAAEVLAAAGVAGEGARACVRWSRGAPGAALELSRKQAPALREIVVDVLGGTCDASEALERYSGVDCEYEAKTDAASARIKARAFLDLALDVLADLRRASAGVDIDALAHGDLCTSASETSEARRGAQLEECLLARQDVDLNLSPDAALERALLALEPRTRLATPANR